MLIKRLVLLIVLTAIIIPCYAGEMNEDREAIYLFKKFNL